MKLNDIQKKSLIITIVFVIIGLTVGAELINVMASSMSQIPTNGFIVLQKEQKADGFLVWHWTDYAFRYGNKTNDWVSVSSSQYCRYNVGDFCNDTNWVFVS